MKWILDGDALIQLLALAVSHNYKMDAQWPKVITTSSQIAGVHKCLLDNQYEPEQDTLQHLQAIGHITIGSLNLDTVGSIYANLLQHLDHNKARLVALAVQQDAALMTDCCKTQKTLEKLQEHIHPQYASMLTASRNFLSSISATTEDIHNFVIRMKRFYTPNLHHPEYQWWIDHLQRGHPNIQNFSGMTQTG